jgi:trimeric autotransporter adhesin
VLAAQPKTWPKFTRFRGTTKRLRFALVDENGAPFAHAGCTLIFTVKADPAAEDTAAAVQKLSTVGGISVVDATTIDVELVPADDEHLTPGETYQCDVKAQAADGRVTIAARATLTIAEAVTHGTELAIPTTVVHPASPYLSAEEIEANRLAAEQAAAAAAASQEAASESATLAGQERDAAVTARAGAEAAQLAAETAQTGAVAAKNAADADVLATAADRAAVAADKTTVAADKATVAADKATVAADKATVATDKAAAANSATQAAASATAAAGYVVPSQTGNAGKMLRTDGSAVAWADRDTVLNLAATGLLARSAANTLTPRTLTGTSPVQVANGNGVAGNPTISVDAASASASGIVELATLAATLAGTDAVRAVTPAAFGYAAAALRNALAPRGGVAFDGVAGSRVTSTLTGQSIGSDAFTISGIVRVPTANPSSAVGLIIATPSSIGANVQGASGLYVNSSGGLDFSVGNVNNSNYRVATVASLVANYGGKTVHIVGIRDGNAATVYINGVSQNLTYSGPGNISDPLTSATTYLVLGVWNSNQYSGAIYSASLYNLALSASDVQEIYELGGGVPERFKFGTKAQSSNSFTNDGGVGAFHNSYSGSSSGFTGTTTNNPDPTSSRSGKITGLSIRAGQSVRVRFDWNVSAASATGIQQWIVRDQNSNGANLIGWTTFNSGANGAGSVDTVFASLVNTSNAFAYIADGLGSGESMTLAISNYRIEPLGAVVHLSLDDGGGFQLRDVSTNALHALMTATGVSHVRPLNGPFRAKLQSNTNGNQQLGGQVVIPANAQILRVRARASTGTPNVTLGTSSGGAQVVASVALSTAWQTLTIALTGGQVGSSNISLWAGSNSTATIDWDISWEPLSP